MTERLDKELNATNDKNLVILCVTLLAMASICFLGADAPPIVSSALSGLFGVAVGKSMS